MATPKQLEKMRNALPALTFRQSTEAGLPGLQPKPIPAEIPSNAIIPEDDGSFTWGRFHITSTGVELPQDTTEDEWRDLGKILIQLEGAINWALGDWLAFADNRSWGETYQKFAEEYELQVDTLYTYAWLCRKVSIRNRDLTFAHHRLVVGMDADKQAEWLNYAAAQKMSVSQMREAINPTTPPTPLDKASGFIQKQRQIAGKLEPFERMQLATLLRQLAEELEG